MVNKTTPSRRYSSVWTYGWNAACAGYSDEYAYTDISPYKVQLGSDMPQWQSVIRSGGNASNPYTSMLTLNPPGYGSMHTQAIVPYTNVSCGVFTPTSRSFGAFGSHMVSPRIDFSSLSTSDVRSNALASFVRKSRKEMTKIDSGVTLGEIGEVLHFIKSPLRSVAHHSTEYVNSMRKALNRPRRSLNIRDFTAMAGDAYLSYNYSVKPLIADISSGVNAYNKLLEGPTSRGKIIRGSAKASMLGNVYKGILAFNQQNLTYTQRENLEVEVSYYGYLLTSRTMGSGYALDVLGLSVDNFLPTLWELVPFSFLIDQVANFDDIISSTAFDFRRFTWINRTTFISSKIVESTAYMKNPTGSGYIWEYGFGEVGSSSPSSFSVDRSLRDPNAFYEVPGLIVHGKKLAKMATSVLSIIESRNLYQRDLQHKFPDQNLKIVPLNAARKLSRRGFR